MAPAGSRSGRYLKRGVRIAILAVILVFILIPLWWAITLSFNADAVTAIPKFSWWPENISFRSFEFAFRAINLPQLFCNTLFIAITNTVISVFFAMCCGYAFSKGRFAGKKFWYFFMLAVMIIPFESRMIPLYLQYSVWRMIDTYWPLILGNFAYVFGMVFATSNINSLPDAIRESASIDGAGEWRIFIQLILPLCKPVIAALCILQMVTQWNSYLWPMVVIRSKSKQMLSVGIALFNAKENSAYLGPRMVVSVLGAIPLVVAYLFLQKHIVASVAMTGIKQ